MLRLWFIKLRPKSAGKLHQSIDKISNMLWRSPNKVCNQSSSMTYINFNKQCLCDSRGKEQPSHSSVACMVWAYRMSQFFQLCRQLANMHSSLIWDLENIGIFSGLARLKADSESCFASCVKPYKKCWESKLESVFVLSSHCKVLSNNSQISLLNQSVKFCRGV